MPIQKETTLNTRATMPRIGLGTWKSEPGAVEIAVEHALKNGYKHIDTAAGYSNEKEVGLGIKASGIPRSEIFLTTKLNNPDHGDVLKALDKSLELLGTDYVDLYLMHWPAPMTSDWKADKSLNWLDTWKAMEKIYQTYPEKVKAIGVSNVSVAYLEELLKVATVIPAVNQVERHPFCLQEDVLAACTKAGIVVTAYSPLGSDNSPLLTNDVVVGIAEKYNITPANVLVSFQVNTPNVNVLPKSVTPSRIVANFNVVDLTEDEITKLKSIDNKTTHFRACPPHWTGWGSLGFPDC